MAHEVIIVHPGKGPGGEVTSTLSFKPSHDLPDRVVFKRLQYANKVLEELGDYLYAPHNGAEPAADD